jgi:ATP-binding cassette subfamily B protein
MNTTKLTLKLYWQHAWRYPYKVIGILIFTPLTILAGSFLTVLITARILSRLSTHSYIPGHLWASFGHDLTAYALLQISSGMIGWRIVDILTWRLEGNVERDIAQRVFDHLLTQSPNFHANRFGGSLVSQTNKLMGSYIRFADTTIFQVIPLLAALVSAGIILSLRAPAYAAVLIIFSLIYMTSAIFVTKRVRKRSAEQAAAESQQTGNLADAVTNVMAIKSFAGRQYENKRFADTTEKTFGLLLRLMRAHNTQQAYFGTMSNGILVLSLFMAILSAMQFHANLAAVFLILSYTGNISRGLFEFSNSTLRNYNRSLGDAADMVTILQIKPEIADPVRPEESRIHRGDISFETVVFTHDGANDALFNGLTIRIKAGEKVGLVGHSGSGKTTFTRLLLRFSDIDSGQITIDGQDISRLTQDDLRRHIAYVPQEPVLFHRSLAENIGYGRPDASQQEIEAVAKLAHAHDFITLLPNGYETLVGERGVKLSGGQRQRITIARAILKNAPILVLDEATSSLDSESEALIQSALWKLMEGRTAIVVAHRLSTIQKMDRIIVLDDGRIVEQGSHKELLHANGAYARLWTRQSGGFIEE